MRGERLDQRHGTSVAAEMMRRQGRSGQGFVGAALVMGAKSLGAKIYERTGVTGVLTEKDNAINLMRWTVPPTGIAMCQSAGV
ncbi:hypothetical protein ACFQFQ_25665 [Sulfitobacter porphyrae]|uniref:N-acetyltransferase domain-containing protein n=1 Tax=Sulfitobacter porphyrae TaxID=1246864 RepID=A0ABW2B6P5_9RHOB